MLASFVSHVPPPFLFAIPMLAIWLPFVFFKDAKDRSRGIMPAPKDVRAAGKGEKWDELNKHHTPVLTASRKELATSTPARLLAPSTPYALCHGNPVDSLSLSDSDATTQMLSRDWGIENREDLLCQLYDLLREGHRADYEKLRRRCKNPSLVAHMLSKVENSASHSTSAWEKQWQIQRLLANDRGIQSIDFSAWDFLRAAMLTRAGAGLGWLTEGEAWDTLAVINRALQRSYSSWDEAWEAFRITRWFWAAERPSREEDNNLHDRNRGEFLVGTNGLWTAIPWEAPYPTPRFLLLDAVMELGIMSCLSPDEWKHATAWDLELDGQTQARLGFTLP